MEQHQRKVKDVSTTVKSFYDRKEKFRIFHGSTNSTRNQALRDRKNVVDTSRLNHVLQVDAEKLVVITEPNVAMDRLVEATLDHDLVPLVVMDFPGITAGGGYAGTSGESSSFKHGFFDQTLEYVEMVLANGDVAMCSKTEHADLFHGAAGALGTMGVVTLLCIRLQRASKYVEATYHPVGSISEAVQQCRDLSSDTTSEGPDYVDGILFSETSGVVMTGRQTDTETAGLHVRRFSDANDPWFYLHAQEVLRTSSKEAPVKELIPLPEYLFRYDRGGFWVGKTTFQYFLGLLPFNQTTRRLTDDFMHTRMLYAGLHSQPVNILMVQDLALPYRSAQNLIEWQAKEVKIWPLWLCPLRQSRLPTMHPHAAEYEDDGKSLQPLLNIGLWGISPLSYDAWVSANEKLEAKLRDLNGMKWLYASNLQTEEHFWSQFDKSWYHALRDKYHASYLPTVYEKVHTDVEKQRQVMESYGWKGYLYLWPLGGIRAMKGAWESGVWREARKSTWMGWVPR